MAFDQMFDTNDSRRVLEPFWFEKIDVSASKVWIEGHQKTSIYISVGYVVLTFLGQQLMRNRKAFDLRKPLIIWNCILAIFSLTGFLRTAPTFLILLSQHNGVYRSICTRDYVFDVDAFWGLLFTLSKIFELVDTVFIVLRKAPVLFLHWFHHMSMVTFTFHLSPIGDPLCRYGGVLNYGIHAIMYSYYALKVAKVRIPKLVSILITTLQMCQFCAALLACIYAVTSLLNGHECIISNTTLAIHVTGGITYLSLFANFFYQTYMVNKKVKSM